MTNLDLGRARWVVSQPVAKITTNSMHNNTAGEAMKKLLVYGRLLCLRTTYLQGSAVAATGEWRDEQ